MKDFDSSLKPIIKQIEHQKERKAEKLERSPITYILLYCGLTAIFIGFITYFALSPIFGCCTAILGTIALLFSFVCKARDKKNFLHQQDLKLQKHIEDVQNNIAPIVEDIPCKHCNGLPIGENSLCQLTVFQDVIYLNSGTMEFQIPMERIIDIDISTTVHTDYDLKSHPMRGVIGGLLLGEFGLLWGAEHELVKTETKEYFLVIAYNKEETVQFITLGDIDCNKVLSEVNKYVKFQRKNIEL